MTTELASTMLSIASVYMAHRLPLPAHVQHELQMVLWSDEMPPFARSEAARALLENT